MELIARETKPGGREAEIRLERRDNGYVVEVDGHVYEVDAVNVGGRGDGTGVSSLIVDGRQYAVSIERRARGRYGVSWAGDAGEVEVADPLEHLAQQAHGAGAGGAHQVSAYMPGRVVAVLVAEGETVEAGQGLVVLEAMKMENEIQAEAPGVVTKILVEAGQAVEGGDPLFEIGPVEE